MCVRRWCVCVCDGMSGAYFERNLRFFSQTRTRTTTTATNKQQQQQQV